MVVGRLKENRVKFRNDAIKNCISKIKLCISKEWTDLLKLCDVPMQDDAVEILLCLGTKTVNISQVKTQNIYQVLLHTRFKQPAAEEKWSTVFPNHIINNIWKNIDIPNTPHTVFNLDFKIRHRRIFTSIILHQISKDKYARRCYVCKEEDEDIEHLFLRCKELKDFQEKLWELLADNCGTAIPQEERKWTFLFGIGKRKEKEKDLINMILAFARQAAFNRRNYALYEGKGKNAWTLFTCTLKAHLKLVFGGGKGFCTVLRREH